MGRLGSVIGEGLRKFFYLLAFFYVRVNGKVYMDGISGALPLVSDLPGCGRWGFASLGSLLYGKKGPVVVLIGTVSGAREFAKLFCEGLCDCRAVYAVGADVREVLSGVLAMGEAMRRPGLIAVWSAVARGESVPAFAHLFLYLFWVCLWVVFFYVGYFFPTDDLLRHAVSYKWGYDYNVPYFDSVYMTKFDSYYVFDVVVGFLHRILGKGALLFPQLFALSLSFFGLNRILRGTDNGLRVLVLLLMLVLLTPRFILGRPSVVCSSMMVFLLAFREELPSWVKVAVGSLMGSLYYLCWIYFVPLLIFERKYIVCVVASLFFWIWYSHGAYFGEVWHIIGEMGLRNVRITENATILGFFVWHWVFGIPFVLYMTRDWRTAVSVAVLSLTNQVRYVESVAPLVLGYFRFVRLRVSAVVVIGVVFFGVTVPRYKVDAFDPMAFRGLVPSGSRVLSDEMSTAYLLVFWDGSLKVSPHYGYGLTPKDTQAVYADFAGGRLDCGSGALSKFDFIVERSLKGASPSCLEAVGTVADRRVWRIRRGI